MVIHVRREHHFRCISDALTAYPMHIHGLPSGWELRMVIRSGALGDVLAALLGMVSSGWRRSAPSGGYTAVVLGNDLCGRGRLWRQVPASCGVEIRVSDPKALPELLDALATRVDFVVEVIGPDRVGVSVLGSFTDGGTEELGRFLRECKARDPGLDAHVEGDLRGAVLQFAERATAGQTA